MSENPSPLPFLEKKTFWEVTIHPHPHLKPLYSKSFLQSTSTSLLIINPLHSRVAHRSFDFGQKWYTYVKGKGLDTLSLEFTAISLGWEILIFILLESCCDKSNSNYMYSIYPSRTSKYFPHLGKEVYVSNIVTPDPQMWFMVMQ